MSHAAFPEPGLAADLYIKAIEHEIPHLLKHGGEFAPKEDLAALANAFRNSAKKLIDMNVVSMNSKREWVINDDAIDALTEDDAQAFSPYYDTVVRAHVPVLQELENSGKGDYVAHFNAVHKTVELEEEREVVEVYTDDSKREIVGASLALIEAIDSDPANAAFVKGLSVDDIDALRDSLAGANYLMPADAPEDRKAPISEQALRGTADQQDAIIENAIVVATNLELPDSIPQQDRPLMASALLKNAVANAQSEEVIADNRFDPVTPNPFNSDLLKEDAEVILNLVRAGNKLAEGAQLDIDNPENVVVSQRAVLNLIEPLQVYRDNNTHSVLLRKDLFVPGLSADSGQAIARTATAMVDILNYRPEKENDIVSSDEGAASTESGFDEEDESRTEGEDLTGGGSGADVVGRGSIKDRSASDKAVLQQIKEDERWAERVQMARELSDHVDKILPKEEETVSIPMELFNSFDSASINLVYKGIDQTLARIADMDISDMTNGVDRGTHATFQEALRGGASRSNVTLVTDDFAMSARRFNEVQSTNRTYKVEPERGIFEGTSYHPPHASVAQKYVNEFVRMNKTQDGEPNVKFRAALREMNRSTVVAASEAEAVAWKLAAQREVSLDDDELALRKEAKENDKMGITTVDIPRAEAEKFVDIVIASESTAFARSTISKDGNIRLTHPDGPAINIMSPTQIDGVEGVEKSGRQAAAMFDPHRMRAAIDASPAGKDISIVLLGENVKGFISKVENQNVAEKEERPIDRHPDMALS